MLQKECETADAVAGDTRKSVCSDAESLKDECAGDQDSPLTQEKEKTEQETEQETEQKTVLTRAAHCLYDAAEKVTSGISLSSIGEKVVTFINQNVVQPARDSASSDNEDGE
ncbi:hypothetical protein PsorP6_017606 [Peronosclerospora sorghi]|uniref:Uncharacterized protein n=1 Tax=Peronosclerospora sorghi TaxID=230839 RepID=A0ACC0WKR0_9STRA|nr:hypothetical protein PsorP6_017606 [Peronosclerospora sorghi]